MIKVKYFQFFFFSALSFLLGCTGSVPDNSNDISSTSSTLTSKIEKVKFEIVAGKELKGINISDIEIDTAYIDNESRGVKLSFNIDIAKSAIDSIVYNGYTSYFLELSTETTEGKIYSSKSKIDKKQRIHSDKEYFISHASRRALEFIFPYRLLEMPEGTQDLLINIDAYPSKFHKDTSTTDYKYLEQIASNHQTSVQIKIKVKAPKLYKASVAVYKFKLNDDIEKLKRMDFSMGGSGYPDLYWDLYCGGEYLYYSPQHKNVLEYKTTYSSKPFYCSAEDLLKIDIMDFDNGPFNTQDDKIETWTSKVKDIVMNKTDTLSFGNLEYLIFSTKIEK